MFALRHYALLVLFFFLLLLTSCSSTTSPAPTPTRTPSISSQWVIAWGASSQNALPSAANPGGTEQSFRFVVLPSVGATEERVHFSNQFGTSAITIGAARLAVAISGRGPATNPALDAPLTFGGSSAVTLAAGQEIDSDPVNLTYTFGQWLAVSMYMPATFPPLTEHNSQVSNNYASPVNAGNTTPDTTGAAFSQVNQEWYVVSAVEAYGPYAGTVAFFGSSSVDGHASNFGSTNSYPVPNVADPTLINDRPTDWLARSLNTAGIDLGVLNAGLLGDPAGEDATTAVGNVTAGINRFHHDVVAQPGIKAVIIYTGGIDLRGDCLNATAVEASLANLVARRDTRPASGSCLRPSRRPNIVSPPALNPQPLTLTTATSTLDPKTTAQRNDGPSTPGYGQLEPHCPVSSRSRILIRSWPILRIPTSTYLTSTRAIIFTPTPKAMASKTALSRSIC